MIGIIKVFKNLRECDFAVLAVLLIGLMEITCPLRAYSDDSIPETTLQEFTVVAERGWIEDGKIVFIPTKSEKKLANSPATLIGSMNLPMLREENGQIIGPSGTPVAVFINGKRADSLDISTFWPMLSRRVEFIQHPSDPIFEGESAVVNFIVKEFTAGGLTKVDGEYSTPLKLYGSVASKLVYKRMTFTARVYDTYNRDKDNRVGGTESFNDLYYGGSHYDRIERLFSERVQRESNSTCFSFKAEYVADKVQIRHFITLDRSIVPHEESTGENTWSDNLFDSAVSSWRASSRSLTPSVGGSYLLHPNDKWYLSSGWSYLYSRNRRDTWNHIGSTDPISNSCTENVNSLMISVMPSFCPSPKWIMQGNVTGSFDWFDSKYAGSFDDGVKQSRKYLDAGLKFFWTPVQNLSISLQPSVKTEFREVGSYRETFVTPSAQGYIDWDINRKATLGASLLYISREPDPSQTSTATIRESELVWVSGNPQLRDYSSWHARIHSTLLLSNIVTMSGSVGYAGRRNAVCAFYRPAEEEMGGLIRQYENAPALDQYNAKVDVRLNLFKQKLSLSLSPAWEMYKTYGEGGRTLNTFNIYGSLSYTLSNFRIQLLHTGPFASLDCGGMKKIEESDRWDLSLTYGNGNLYVKAGVKDLFNKWHLTREEYTSDYYSSNMEYNGVGRKFFVELTYTFSYGKKVDSRIDAGSATSAKSGILK